MSRRWNSALGVCLALAAAACQRPKDAAPEEAYAAFAKLLQQGDAKGAYQALSTPTRQAIEEKAKALSRASGGAVRDDPALLTFATGVKPAPLSSVKLVSQQGDVAFVEATGGAGPVKVQLVREVTGWKVDLKEWFKK